jgi:hypothetical protein
LTQNQDQRAPAATTIHENIATALREQARLDNAAQAVRSIDSWSERQLQQFLAEAMEQRGYIAHREYRYPHTESNEKQSERYCDLMIQHYAALPSHLPGYWLEVKRLAQFQNAEPNRNYSHWLLQPVTNDVQKLIDEPAIRHCGLLLVLFTADEATARHDTQVWLDKLEAKSIAPAHVHTTIQPITDRQGNTAMRVVLADLSQTSCDASS